MNRKIGAILNQDSVIRFWDKVEPDPDTGCWEWQAFRNKKGYGLFQFGKRRGVHASTSAHRISYWFTVGEIPEGLQLDHLCRNPGCVNPEHLEAVTPAENSRRAIPFRPPSPTHCPAGHSYAEVGYLRRQGWYACKDCHRISNRLYARRISAERRLAS